MGSIKKRLAEEDVQPGRDRQLSFLSALNPLLDEAPTDDGPLPHLCLAFTDSHQVFESFAVLKRRPAANLDAEERAQHLQVAVSGYWERVVQEPHVRVRPGEIVENCLHRNPVSIRPPVPSTPPSLHRTTPPAPPHHSSQRTPRQHPRRVHGTRTNAFVAQPRRVDPDIFQTHTRRREPLPYPPAFRPDNQVPGFILDPQTGSYLPTSAVFFASRFNRLRELSRLLSHEERPAGYENPTIVHKIKVEIYSTLISMLLYYLGQPEMKGTPSSLRFNYEEWQDVYEQCDWSGSEVFGTRAGFGLNRDFFLGLLKREIFDEWTTKATEWWVPGEGHEVAELRAMMGEKWLHLKAELWMFYEDVSFISLPT